MLDTHAARAAIAAAMPRYATIEVPLADACGRVLHQDVVAERDQPPFDRVTMDGIALRHAALAGGRRHYAIVGTQHAGDPVQTLAADEHCIEVMTGAALPAGSDCVVPVERIAVEDGHATVETGYAATPAQFVHARASDHRRGYTMLARGRLVTALDVALIASAGCDVVQVAKRPTVRVVSTGSELVPAGRPLEPQQIRLSNGPALMAMLASHGYDDCRHDHLVDEPALLRERLAGHLDAADVLVLSGGVSMGKADFVPRILGELGVELVFHKIAQRPGKPMWFGRGHDGQAVFALPGNPVSTLVCCRHYVLPALLLASGGAPRPAAAAVLATEYRFAPDLTCFLPVAVATDAAGRLTATPVPTNTSGDFTSLAASDGYLELARSESTFARGSVQALHYWRQP